MEVAEAIEKRQSARRFKDRDVESEKIRALLEAARKAPSWKNLQCWNFVVVRDKDVIKRLVESKAVHPKNGWARDAPVWIIAAADPSRSGNFNGHEYYMMDMGVALQQMVLRAVELGLGTTYLGLYDEERTREELDIPDPWRVVAILPFGYPDWKEIGKMKDRIEMHESRRGAEEIGHGNRWGVALDLSGPGE